MPSTSFVAAVVASVRAFFALLLIWSAVAGAFYGWVLGSLLAGIVVSLIAICQPFLELDWEAVLADQSDDEDDEVCEKRNSIDFVMRVSPTALVSPTIVRKTPPTGAILKSLDSRTLKLLEESYGLLGCPYGNESQGFEMWVAEFTSWVWEDDRWLAILPKIVIEVRESA